MNLVGRLPDQMSDEECEGLLKVLPPDTASNMEALLVPRVRETSMAFLKMIAKWLVAARAAKEQGKKVILAPFNFPPELVHAFRSAVPLTSEVLSTLGVAVLEGQGDRYWDAAMSMGIPDHLCSSNTIELGSMLSGRDFEADAIISSAPGSCDANSKLHELAAHHLGIPQFILEKPTDNTEEGKALYRKYLRSLVNSLEEFTGERLEEERLRQVVDYANRATELYYDIWELHKAVPCPVPNVFALFLYGTRFTAWGTQDAVSFLEKMVEVSEQRRQQGSYPAKNEVARCLWIYTGYYFDFLNYFNWMEENGISYLYDALCLFFPKPIDTSNKETMLDGIAEASWNMPMTRQMGGDSMSIRWIEDIVQSIQELEADCAIYCGHHSCKQTWSVFSLVRQELMKRTGVPTLRLQGDSWMRSMTPMTVLQKEIEQFVGNVVVRKRKKRGAKASRPVADS